jgi:hypothetical protein
MTHFSLVVATETGANNARYGACDWREFESTLPRPVYRRPAMRLFIFLAWVILTPACRLFYPPVTSVGTAHEDMQARAGQRAREQGRSLAQGLATDFRSQATALLPVLATQQLDAVTALLVEWYDLMTDVFPTSQTVWTDGMPRLHDVRQRARFQQENLLRGGVWEHGLPAQVAAATAELMDTLTRYELDREALGSLPPERWLELRDAYNGWIEVITTLAQAATQDPVQAWLGDGAARLVSEPERGGSEAGQGVLPDEL